MAKKYDKKHNEDCFLPNNEKIKYNSIILLESFNIEEFNDLIKGLDKLYENYSPISDLDYYNLFDNDKMSFRSSKSLPTIANSNFDNIPLISLQIDLGNHIRFLIINLHRILPSMVMLQIQAFFDNKISEELNEVIYKHHESEIIYHDFPEEIPNQKIYSIRSSTHYHPEKIKTKEITEIRLSLKKELIDFFSKYFEGFFFKISSNDRDIVPSIEIYSLNYPDDNGDIIEWGRKVRGFMGCFGATIHQRNCFKMNEYLFLTESNHRTLSNYLLFSNNSEKDSIPDFTNYSFDTTLFETILFSRWLRIQEQMVGKYSSVISEEIVHLQKNQLEDVLKNRRVISEGIFYFERFKTEFELFNPSNSGFKLIGDAKINLSPNWMKNISKEIKNVENIINIFNKHSNVILGLKNVEYNIKNADKVNQLTWVVILLAIIQVILAILNFRTDIFNFLIRYGDIISILIFIKLLILNII